MIACTLKQSTFSGSKQELTEVYDEIECCKSLNPEDDSAPGLWPEKGFITH